MKKFNYIDLAKTIAMFLVILCHSLLFFSDNPYWLINADYKNDTAAFLYNMFSCTVIPMFVFCSGFLFQISMKKRELVTVTAIVGRAKRLLLPYLLYGILWLVPTYTLFDIPSYGRPKGSSLLYGYKSMLLGQFSDVAWFLMMLFWVSVIWIILRKLLKKERVIIGAAAAVVLYITAHTLLSEISYYKLSQVDIYIVIFFAGASFFWITDKINKLSMPILMTISLIGVIVCAILTQYMMSNYWIYCILAIILPVVILILSMGLCKLKLYARIENTRTYEWLLKHNMDIYLMQAPGMYLGFMILYPLIGQYCFLCIAAIYIFTILCDIILVRLLSFFEGFLVRLHGKFKKAD